MDYSQSKIKDIPKVDRPREKLAKLGPDALSNTELLAIILGSGTKEQNVLRVSERILKKYGGNNLLSLSFEDLKQNSGIGHAKACQLVAAFELYKRLSPDGKGDEETINCPQDVYSFSKEIKSLRKEHFIVIYLNAKNKIIKKETISIGTLNSSLVHPREVFQPAVGESAASVILVHNHPSGDLEPSQDDLALTKRLCEAGKIMGIEVLDHIIIGTKGFLSLKERNLML